MVSQGLGVAIDIVGPADQRAVRLLVVADEGDRGLVAAEGGSGERQPAGGMPERVPDRIAPAARITRVVNLVEDHQRGGGQRHRLVVPGAHGHACVGDRDTIELARAPTAGAGARRIELNTHLGGCVRPLGLQVLGRHDDDDPADGLGVEQFRGDAQREGRLACSRCGHSQEVAGIAVAIDLQRRGLPGTQPRGRTPRSALREGRREPVEGCAAHECTAVAGSMVSTLGSDIGS